MKNTFRLLALSTLVLTVLGFSAVGVMALTPVSSPEVSTAVATLGPRNEVVGVVTTIDANTVTVDGTVYDLKSFTETKGTIQVGDTVRLELTANPDGSLTVDQIDRSDPASDPGMHATSTEPVITETASPDQGSSNNSMGPTAGNNGQGPDNGSNLNNNNGSSQDNGNGSGSGNGNRSSQDSNNGSGHDSGSGSGNTAGSGGN